MTSKIELCNFEQGSKEWYEARAGRITGTRLKSVMSTKTETRETLIYTMIYEKIAPLQDVYQSGAMERGHQIETVVKALYKEQVTNVGFIKRLDNEYLGISPDGIIVEHVGETAQGEIIIHKAVEVKGPLGTNFVRYWLDDKIPSEYFWQVVHYFVVIDTLETLDFIIHNPEPYDERVRTKIITVTREELKNYISQAECAIFDFIALYTKLLGLFIENVKREALKQ